MKVTQTLIDIVGKDLPLHWRGDTAEFRDFHLAFENLKGREPVSEESMLELEAFLATTYMPPNPYRGPWFSGFAYMNSEGRLRGPGTDPMSATFFGNDMFERSRVFYNSTNWDRFCGQCHQLGLGKSASRLIGENLSADLRTTYRKLGFWTQSDESTAGFGMMADGLSLIHI